jgi:hypothetical protein
MTLSQHPDCEARLQPPFPDNPCDNPSAGLVSGQVLWDVPIDTVARARTTVSPHRRRLRQSSFSIELGYFYWRSFLPERSLDVPGRHGGPDERIFSIEDDMSPTDQTTGWLNTKRAKRTSSNRTSGGDDGRGATSTSTGLIRRESTAVIASLIREVWAGSASRLGC